MRRYAGRAQAGVELADELRKRDLGSCIVAGISPGGMVVSAAVAERLGVPLAAVQVRELVTPRSADAFGAMDEDGHTILDYRAVVTLGLGDADLDDIKAVAAREMERQAAARPQSRLGDCPTGRTVVLVDDALASGFAMQAAVAYAQRHGATAVVVAVPCASERAAYELRSLLCRADDELVCLRVGTGFRAASDYYEAFPPVSDTEVLQLLGHATTPLPARG